MAYQSNINSRRATIGITGENLATPSKNVEIIESEGDNLTITDVNSKLIQTSFGRPEDYVELHIFNTANQLLLSEPNFTDYTKSYNGEKITTINVDAEQILISRNYTSGQYKLRFHILRNKIFNTSYLPFEIRDISVSRREVKSIVTETDNELFDVEVENFILEIEGASYFKEFLLNFGQGTLSTGINLILNTDPLKHELILKTSEPLPNSVQKGHSFKVVEELAEPFIIDVDLGGAQIDPGTIELKGPNFQINTRQENSIPSGFKSYNEILDYSVSSSYSKLLNKLENPDTLNIQYDYIRTVSSSMEELERPYHFENFVHFSSAVDRLKNFKFKLKQIEDHEAQLVSASLTTNSENSTTFTEYKIKLKNKKRDIIKSFDGYEQFLYYTTGSNPYTWPKDNPIAPYNLYSITSSEAKDWLGDINSSIPHSHYTGQLHSASYYDNQNEYRLTRIVPDHIISNPNNNFYKSFVNMTGQLFDHIWTHIKHLTEISNLDNKFGISKELVYFQLKSLGIDTFDQFENANLFEYILGESIYGNSIGDAVIGEYIIGGPDKVFYNVPQGTKTYVTASNEGSTPKGDITKEIWKRIYNNAPYLLKTKGTERGIHALMNCYGIPRTILNVKEYGGSTLLSGPLKDLETAGTYKTFSYEKSGLTLKGESGTGGYFIKTRWSSSKTDALSASMKTVEFRINPKRIVDNDNNPLNQHLFTLSGSDASKDPHLILTPYTGNDISQSNDATKYGRLEAYVNGTSVAQTNYFQVFDGNFWNISIGASGSHNTVHFGARQANYLKRILEYKTSFEQNATDRQLTFGDPTNGGNNIGGALNAYFGGVPANNASAYDNIDGLRFSGSIQEIKYHFGEFLTDHTLKKTHFRTFYV